MHRSVGGRCPMSAGARGGARRRCYARPMAGRLYLVPTPIGNSRDLSPRAREVLARVAVVAAEDTRHYATLARAHGLPGRSLSYHDHNEAARVPQLLDRLRAGEDVALVTDAGTPLINDPGFSLVEAAVAAGLE